MKIQVRLFATLRQIAGWAQQPLDMPEGAVTAPEKGADEGSLQDESPGDVGTEAEAVDSEASDEPLKPSSNVLAFGAHRRRVDTSS